MDEHKPTDTTESPPDEATRRVHIASAGQTNRLFNKDSGLPPEANTCRLELRPLPRATAAARPNLFVRILKNFMLGLVVLGGELRWLTLKGLRSLELRQLEKRLHEEYAALGKELAEQGLEHLPDNQSGTAGLLEPESEAALALRQITFLGQEIALHKEERLRMRQEFIERRRQLLGTLPER